MREIKNYEKAYTHGGVFHADDVFATAFIRKLNPDLVTERVFKVPEGTDPEKVLVYDIGGPEGYTAYDHHQSDREVRPDGTPYSSIGLLWKAHAHELGLTAEQAEKVDGMLIKDIDSQDNGGKRNALSDMIFLANPLWDKDEKPAEQFEKMVKMAGEILDGVAEQVMQKNAPDFTADEILAEAFAEMTDTPVRGSLSEAWEKDLPELEVSDRVKNDVEKTFVKSLSGERGILHAALEALPKDRARELAGEILERNIAAAQSRENGENILSAAYEKTKNHVMVLDRFVPTNPASFKDKPEAWFFIYPSLRGGYNIQAVAEPTPDDPMAKRAYFPEKWLGNPDRTLGMTFCHPGNFLATADTPENAVKIAETAVSEHIKHIKEMKEEKKINETEYKKIPDAKEYIAEELRSPIRPQLIYAEKFANVIARPAKEGETIDTISEDSKGNAIKERDGNAAHAGDYIVTKADRDGKPLIDKNGNENTWIVSGEEFEKKYEATAEDGIYKPKGQTQTFLRVTEPITVTQWGGEYRIDRGGYANITNPDDVYFISNRDFTDTYRETGKSAPTPEVAVQYPLFAIREGKEESYKTVYGYNAGESAFRFAEKWAQEMEKEIERTGDVAGTIRNEKAIFERVAENFNRDNLEPFETVLTRFLGETWEHGAALEFEHQPHIVIANMEQLTDDQISLYGDEGREEDAPDLDEDEVSWDD